MVRNEASGHPLYISRGPQVVRFNKRSNAHPPAGIYRCDVPESTGLTISIYINITDIVIDCGALPNPANGQVNTSSGTTLNRFAAYSCYTGYVRTGYSRRVCRADGRWSPTTPTCVIVDCGIPPNPPNGYVDTSTGTVFNSLAMYSCDVVYMLVGNSLSVCGPDGMWSPGTPSCPIVDCGPLHDPDNGMVDTSRGTTCNSRATYACDRGYIRNGTVSRICQPDGMWSATEPVCNPVDCGALHNPENGIVDTSAGTTLGHNATYRCNTGYRRRGSMFRTCNADGIWTPSQPSCDPFDCGSLPHPENGRVNTSSGTTFQKVSHYSCYVGYTLSGAMTRRCTASGQWIPDAPYCPIVDCGPLLNPDKGHVNTSSGTTYNRVAFYTCIEGYELVGEPKRHCDPDGMWTPSAPSCVPVDCGPLRQPKNGVVNTIPDTYLNSTATYSCNPGYNLTGNTQRVCLSNGSWSSSAPYCADSAMVQVKFGPTSHCVEWSESRVELMYRILHGSIFRAIVEKGGQQIAVDKINKGYFSCYSSNTRTTYRTTISGLENTSAVHLAELVQKWVESGVSIRALWYVIKIDKSCPVLISSVDDVECA